MSSEETPTISRGEGSAGPDAGLAGRLGTADVVFSVIAFAAPLLVVVGLMPSVIAFSGYGIVAGFAVTTVVLTFFAVGYSTITRYVENPGACYAYVTAGLGRTAGLGGAFVAVLGYLLLLLTTWIAFGVYFRQLIHDTFAGPDLPWYLYSLLGSAAAGALAYRRIAFSAKALTIALAAEVVLVAVFDIFVFG